MDPLSLTASIIAVVQISGAVISLCHEYRTRAKGAVKEATRITEELKSLKDVLERLLKLAEVEAARGSSRLQTLQPFLEPGGTLPKCQEDLTALQLKLAKLTPETGLKMLMRKLKWPLTEKEVKKVIEDIARSREAISFALIIDQTAISLAIKDKIDIVASTQKDLILDDTRLKLHKWLQPPGPSTNHDRARKLSHSGTGSWLLQHPQYAAWKSGTASSLWLHGIREYQEHQLTLVPNAYCCLQKAGSGKTVICSTVIEDLIAHCHKNALHALIFFYFDFNDIEKQRCGSVLRSAIAQLLTQYPETPDPLINLYNRLEGYLPGHAATDATLLPVLKQTISLLKECYIVFDALDETRPREEMLDFIHQILSWNLPNLHILVTSRREIDIDSTLSPLMATKMEMPKSSVNADITLYIHTRLECDSRLVKWSPGIKAEIKDTIAKGADGMFRWAVCQLDALAKCVKLPMLQATLRSLPRTLEDTYSRILLDIEHEYVRDAISVLRWLAFSSRPLQLEEVVEVLAIDWEIDKKPTFDLAFRLPNPLDLLAICSSLVTLEENVLVSQDASTPQTRTLVKLAHSSVRDYLISDRIGTSPAADYALNKAVSHSFITQCCLIYLLQFTGPLDPRSALIFPLVQYATQFWTHHFQAAGVRDRENLEDMAFTLLTSHQVPYLSWWRFYDPDRPWLAEQSYGNWVEADWSPLYCMSLVGLSQLCKRLLAASADPNAEGGLYSYPLLAACKNGHEKVVELLLKSKANPNVRGSQAMTPLTAAASGGHLQIVKSLLSHGAKVNQSTKQSVYQDDTALNPAARNGHERVVQILLDAGADPNNYARKGGKGPPIVEAALNGHPTIVRQLLPSSSQFGIYQAMIGAAKNGHDVVVRLLIETNKNLGLNLSCAARVGAYDMVSRLIHEGAEVNVNSIQEEQPWDSALSSAINGGHELIIQQLIAEGASCGPDMLSLAVRRGHTRVVQYLIQHYSHDSLILSYLLVEAVKNGFKSIAELLLENGADIEIQSDQGRPLHVAAKSGNLDLLRFLLDRGADIDSEGKPKQPSVFIHEDLQGGTLQDGALQCAACRGNLPMVQYLVEHGADPDKYGYSQRNALQHAASSGHNLVITELLAAGANVNSRGPMGSALHCAINGSQLDTVRLLLQMDANAGEIPEATAENTSPWPNPLLQASMNGEFQIAKILLDAGADPNASSILWGNSTLPLHAAAEIGNIEILQVLLEYGADVNAQAEDGFSAIHFAAYGGHHDALQLLLLDHHADPRVVLFNGSLALHTAASHGYPQCIDVCLEAGLDVSSQNDQGRTALHWATESGHRAAVEKLLTKGVDVNVRELETGMTALDYAKQKAHEQPEAKEWKDLVKLIKAKS